MQFSWWYLFVSIPVIWSLWIGFRVFRGINKPSDFFWYPEGMSSEKLRDSLTASNISVGSAIFAFLSFGYFCNSGKLLLVPYTKDFGIITRF